jgi:hypothetical protein
VTDGKASTISVSIQGLQYPRSVGNNLNEIFCVLDL